MRFMFIKKSGLFLIVLVSGLLLINGADQGFAKKKQSFEPVDPAIFSEFDSNSKIVLNFGDLSEVLQSVVYRVGQSRRILRRAQTETYTGSRFVTAKNVSISRYESNRLLIHDFDKNLKRFFLDYQSGLITISKNTPLKSLNKNAQLAFWFNLHNVMIMNELIDQYPIKSLKKFRKKSKGFFFQQIVEVDGVMLSVSDIEQIIIANWKSPSVIYGLWQGSIGGPSLPNQAFTQKNVRALLKLNAEEFVNSNRGARPSGSKMLVSEFYEWTLGPFQNSEEALLSHIKQLSDGGFHGNISEVNSISFNYYDWGVTDLLGGTSYQGNTSQVGALQSGGSNQKAKAGSGSTNAASGPNANDFIYDSLGGGTNDQNLPPKALELIREMRINNYPPKTAGIGNP